MEKKWYRVSFCMNLTEKDIEPMKRTFEETLGELIRDNLCTNVQIELDEPDDDYTPSAENGDYSPSNPWDAPGMSISDFI